MDRLSISEEDKDYMKRMGISDSIEGTLRFLLDRDRLVEWREILTLLEATGHAQTGAAGECRRMIRQLETRVEPTKFEVGDKVNWSHGTDIHPGTVVEISPNENTILVQEDKMTQVDSTEPDALQFSPGGFAGHTSGSQWYRFKPGDGAPIRFTRRKAMHGRVKLAGVSCRGSMRWWGVLRHGHLSHSDFNF